MELSLNPDKQARLRADLAEFTNKDPTWEQFTYGLPYLDAIAREVIRVHPPVENTDRVVRLIIRVFQHRWMN